MKKITKRNIFSHRVLLSFLFDVLFFKFASRVLDALKNHISYIL